MTAHTFFGLQKLLSLLAPESTLPPFGSIRDMNMMNHPPTRSRFARRIAPATTGRATLPRPRPARQEPRPTTLLAILGLLLLAAPCVRSQTVPATDVADALDAFKIQAVAKIDQDLEANARAFADARNIHISARWGDWFSPFLDIARAVYDGLTAVQYQQPNSVRSWVKFSLQGADSAQKAFSLANSLDRFRQDGQNLALTIDGPAYTSTVNAMLDRADATWFLFFDYDGYRLSILNELNGITGPSPMRVVRKSATVDRNGGEVLPSVFAAKTYIFDQLRTLSTEMRQRQLPPARITEMAAFIEARRRDLLNSRVGNSPISYSAYLLKGSTPVLCPVNTSLGTVSALERWRTTMLGAYTDNVDVELRLRLAETADTGLSVAADTLTEMVSFNLSYEATIAGQSQANEILKNAATLGFSIAKPDVGNLFNTARTSASNAREQINMIPQQMMDALPGEVSKVLLLLDDTLQHARTVAAMGSPVTVTAVAPPTLTASTSAQLFTIYGSNFRPSGDANASLLVFTTPGNNVVARTPTFISTGELRYNLTVEASGTWQVKVVNGLVESAPFPFTVVAQPPPSSGALVVTLSPAGAVSVGAQWRVDGGSYRNSGDTATGLTPGSHTVSFKTVAGYTAPADHIVTIAGGAVANDSGAYNAVTPTTYYLSTHSSHGQVTRTPSGNTFASGVAVRLKAFADSGWHFDHWSGDASGSANPVYVVMDADKDVTAHYAAGDWNVGAIKVTIHPPRRSRRRRTVESGRRRLAEQRRDHKQHRPRRPLSGV